MSDIKSKLKRHDGTRTIIGFTVLVPVLIAILLSIYRYHNKQSFSISSFVIQKIEAETHRIFDGKDNYDELTTELIHNSGSLPKWLGNYEAPDFELITGTKFNIYPVDTALGSNTAFRIDFSPVKYISCIKIFSEFDSKWLVQAGAGNKLYGEKTLPISEDNAISICNSKLENIVSFVFK